jgi:formiminotetrahydrofolate cyclodeaminase
MALAGVEGALLNVRINLASITDLGFRSACLAEVSRIRAQAAGIKASIDRTLEDVFLPEKL